MATKKKKLPVLVLTPLQCRFCSKGKPATRLAPYPDQITKHKHDPIYAPVCEAHYKESSGIDDKQKAEIDCYPVIRLSSVYT